MIDRNEIIKAFPLDAFLQKQGRTLKPVGNELFCQCLFHSPDKNPSMRVNVAKGVWCCDPCGIGGTIIDMVMRLRGLSVKATMLALAEEAGIADKSLAPKKTATYEYKDSYGRPVMFVDRIEQGGEKKFQQYVKKNGETVYSVEGVQRTLYRLEKWCGKQEVSLVEGEKCCEAMERIGYDATTCPGGSNGWLDAYALYLKDKHVDIWPDNDEPGDKWLAAVLQSLEGKVASLKIVRVPKVYGDIADMLDAQGDEIGLNSVVDLLSKSPRIDRGVMLPLLSADECYEMYKERIRYIDDDGVDLSKWLPSLKKHTRILLPGDVAVILSDTGVGKTSAITNIAYSQRPLTTIFFELELSAEAMVERFIARQHEIETRDVEYRTLKGDSFSMSHWKNVFVCQQSKLTVADMENIIIKSELKMQQKPKLILIDYIGLMSGGGGKRYERLSTIAEELKILARTTNTVMIIASQIHRKPEDNIEVGLHDGKDSGSIENSAQLVLGMWRTAEDRIKIKILKNTKRAGTFEIECLFDGHRQKIVEMADEKQYGNLNIYS